MVGGRPAGWLDNLEIKQPQPQNLDWGIGPSLAKRQDVCAIDPQEIVLHAVEKFA